MTIREAIQRLEKIATKHGDACIVYFDCPQCLQSFTPGVVVPQAVHMRAIEDPRPAPPLAQETPHEIMNKCEAP